MGNVRALKIQPIQHQALKEPRYVYNSKTYAPFYLDCDARTPQVGDYIEHNGVYYHVATVIHGSAEVVVLANPCDYPKEHRTQRPYLPHGA